MGGENSGTGSGSTGRRGSSPRGRGKRDLCPLGGVVGGLIPAWAGKTHGGTFRCGVLTAHPRVGGENSHPSRHRRWKKGSSPRGRGKPPQRTLPCRLTRLIPAWAGKTSGLSHTVASAGAHPRVGGENFLGLFGRWAIPGSSPRGRGKRARLAHARPLSGLIPAWAGKTWSCRW